MEWERFWLQTVRVVPELIMGWGLKVLAAFVISVLGWLFARWVGGRVRALAERSGRVDRTLVSVLSKLVRLVILGIVLVAALGEIGIETGSLLAFLGAAGLAIGLALKDTASDVAGGIVLLVVRPFSVGDEVMIGTTWGTVDEIGILQTQLTSVEGIPITIPNSKVRTSEIQNLTRAGRRRIDLTISVGYATDLDHALVVMREVVSKHEAVLAVPAPLVDVTDLGESSVDILVRFWARPEAFLATKLALGRLIKQRLDAEGIEIPFPQRVVRTISAPL